MALADLIALVDRLIEVADALRLRSNHDAPFSDDLAELADEVQEVAEEIQREVE